MISQEQLPRCEKMDGSSLKIVPAYTEAGQFQEANSVTITDGERTAVYVPAPTEAGKAAAKALRRFAMVKHGPLAVGE